MRSLAIGLLVVSLVGGYWLGTDRKTQQHNAVLADGQRSDLSDLYQQKLDAAAQWRANAGQPAPPAGAEGKGHAAAEGAADPAKAGRHAGPPPQGGRPGAPPPP